jgi:tetratricopeptide (TPR) repeat protein
LLAFSEYKQQNIEPALNACLQGLALYQGSRPIAELYVSILREDVSVEERLTRLTESAKQVPHSPILLKALAEELMKKDPENPQALALLSFAAKLAPQDPEVHFFYGESACFSNKDVVCIRELTRAHELSPQNDYANMQLFTMIAVAEDRRKDTVRAAQAFEQAMRANRHLPAPNPYAASKYVTFLITQSKDKEGAVVVDEILKWDPVYGPAHFERAQILARQGQTKEAAEQAELALQDSRVSTAELGTYHAFLAKTYFALGNESEARTHQDWIESHQ